MYDPPVGQNHKIQISNFLGFVQQSLSSKSQTMYCWVLHLWMLRSWFWISALTRWRLYVCSCLYKYSFGCRKTNMHAVCPAISLPSNPFSAWDFLKNVLVLMISKPIWFTTLFLDHDVSLYQHQSGKLHMKHTKNETPSDNQSIYCKWFSHSQTNF